MRIRNNPYVAEKWSRRWITCDTSRVAITLAKQRLMAATYDYYTLKHPDEDLKGGFVYKTVPHVTLNSIANNPEIDEIHERLQPAIKASLAVLNDALRKTPPPTFEVSEGGRRRFMPDFLVRLANGRTLVLEIKGEDSDQDKAKRSALDMWVQAVNSKGRFGVWSADVAFEMARMQDVIGRHAG